jgi:rhamnose utilization protein RhaD (predicted bifunctional aldolase and dehydrogenase)
MYLNWSRFLLAALLSCLVRIGVGEQYVNDDGEQDDEAIVEEYVNEYNNKYDSNAEYVDGNGEIVYFTDLGILPKRCIV